MNTLRNPSRTKLLGFLVLGFALFGTAAFAAQTAPTNVPLAGLTPKQLQDGTAKLVGPYSSTAKLRLVIGLERPNVAGEEAFLKALQTKGDPNFHKFLTAAEWNQRFSPSAANEQAVVDWAQAQGLTVTQRYANRLLVDLEGQVKVIEKALGVTINSYQVGGRTTFSNAQDPVLPESLKGIVHSIGGLNNIQVLRPASKGAIEPAFADYSPGPVSAAAGPAVGLNATAKRPASSKSGKSGPGPNITDGAYDPTDIYSSQAYDVNALYAQGHCCNPLGNPGITPPATSIAIATAGTQSVSDLAGFLTQYPYLAYHYQQINIDGTPSCCDGEGTEDFDWSTAWSNSFGSYADTAMIYLYDGVNPDFSTFTDVYNQILSDGKAKVFTTSWGCEEIYCTPTSVMDTDDGIFNSMAGQGITMMAASGDEGATAGCGDGIAVQYPASDPNIVGAGGTTLLLDSNSNFISESAWSGGPYGCASNDGGSTGGLSAYYGVPFYQDFLGYASRAVPDIALNADFYNSPQNIFYGGALEGNGGTSIVAPSLAGFFAQANAYYDYVQSNLGYCSGVTCGTLGNGNDYLYYLGQYPTGSSHYPYYDITSGCNNNDVTAEYSLHYYCAGTGYDPVTGWGSINALQLAWGIIALQLGDLAAPTATFSGPALNTYFNTDQTVSWTITDSGLNGLGPTGVSGFTQSWDAYIYDSFSEPNQANAGSGDGFYTGPEFPNATSGSLDLADAGQGCHTAYVRSWDNSGYTQIQTYGPVCYDTVPPVTTATPSGTEIDGVYETPVQITLNATDATSGVQATYYKVDAGGYTQYSSPFTVSGTGTHTVNYYSVDVAGNSETPNTLVFPINPSGASLTFSPSRLTFASTLVGVTTATKAITLNNISNVTLTFTAISIGGTNPSSFEIVSKTCGSTLTPGSNCTVNVAFRPAATGSLSATIGATYSGGAGSPQKVPVSGTGVAEDLAYSPSSLTFPSTGVGQTAATRAFTLINVGSTTLTISSIAPRGTDPTSFYVASKTCGSTLAAGANCVVNVAFRPAATGALSATIGVVFTGGTGSPVKAPVSGTGVSENIGYTPSQLIFPSTGVGSLSATKAITFTNTGSTTLGISSIAAGGTDPSSFEVVSKTCGSTLVAGASCVVNVGFKPATTGALSATIGVFFNGGSGSPVKVPVSGTGVTPSLSFSPSSLSFPSEPVGTASATQPITLTNTGTTTLTLSSIARGGTDPTSFHVVSNTCSSSLAAGASCTVNVDFKPTTTGALSATIRVVFTGGVGSPVEVPVSGTGT